MRSGWLSLLVAAAACEIAYQPEVGPILRAGPDGGTGGNGGAVGGVACIDSDPATSVSLSRDVRPLLDRSPGGCSCHSDDSTSGFNLGTYERLLAGGFFSGERIIVPGEPCASVLVQKLGPTPPFGSRMPFNGPPYFAPEELGLVMDWISEGALDN